DAGRDRGRVGDRPIGRIGPRGAPVVRRGLRGARRGRRARPRGGRPVDPPAGRGAGMIVFAVLTRLLAFVGKEIVEVVRRPGVLVSLVLGPFLILLVFGTGYA